MTLQEICSEIAEVEQGLENGNVQFTYSKLMRAMKPGHPADLLDDILSMVAWDVEAGKVIETDRVKQWADALTDFAEEFNIEELDAPIQHITEYIKKTEC